MRKLKKAENIHDLIFYAGLGGITGAVIGVQGGLPALFFAGFVLFVLGLLLKKR